MRRNTSKLVGQSSFRRGILESDGLLQTLEQRALLAVNFVYDAVSSPNALPGSTITVNSTLSNAGDTATSAATPFKVKFYLSSDNVLSTGTDREIGTSTRNEVLQASGGILGFPAQVTIPADVVPGLDYFLFAVADSDNVYPETNESDNSTSAQIFIGNRAPTVGAVTVNPNPVGSLGRFTISAANVMDADAFNNGGLSVRFFYDLDRDGVLSETSDLLLGSGTSDGAGTFSFRGAVPATVHIGTQKVFARVSDGLDRADAEGSMTVVVAPVPSLGNLAGPTEAVRRGRTITLTATGINANNTNPTVQFFRDANGSGAFEESSDTLLLGNVITAGDGSRTLQVTIDPAWGAGNQTFFANATDDLGQTSASDNAVISLLANAAPRLVGKFSANAAALSKGQSLVLTARNVRDDDGPERVDFFRESGGNSNLNDSDALLGTGTRSGRVWTLTLTTPLSFRNGVNRFYARAVDIVGEVSSTKSTTVTISRNTRPVIDAFNINKNTAMVGTTVQFLAQRVIDNAPNIRVEFWYDADLNGLFSATADRLITTANRLGSSNNFRKRFSLPTDLPSGTATFFAVAFDNLGVRGSVKSDVLDITT